MSKDDTLGEQVTEMTKQVTSLSVELQGQVRIMRTTIQGLREEIDQLHRHFEEHIHSEKTIRRRIHATTSVKGVKKLDHTIEGTGYTLEELTEEWDIQDKAVEQRQPLGSE